MSYEVEWHLRTILWNKLETEFESTLIEQLHIVILNLLKSTERKSSERYRHSIFKINT